MAAKDSRNGSANGWSRHEKLVLSELKRHGSWLGSLDGKIDQISVDIAGLKIKAGIWGAIAGAIPATVALLYLILTKK